mmetsp:Transcript_11197/g.32719  ORF Transcript_11197/g.32719 Transcript_11197/m.32719 type:complete len:230 (+) Transcript_11197:268-957(+)|eukprot:scaffold70697_cov29-Tisochrysis_lutea.AAC.3
MVVDDTPRERRLLHVAVAEKNCLQSRRKHFFARARRIQHLASARAVQTLEFAIGVHVFLDRAFLPFTDVLKIRYRSEDGNRMLACVVAQLCGSRLRRLTSGAGRHLHLRCCYAGFHVGLVPLAQTSGMVGVVLTEHTVVATTELFLGPHGTLHGLIDRPLTVRSIGGDRGSEIILVICSLTIHGPFCVGIAIAAKIPTIDHIDTPPILQVLVATRRRATAIIRRPSRSM